MRTCVFFKPAAQQNAVCIKKLLFLLHSVERHQSEAPDKTNNQPHIVLFKDEEDDDNLLGQHFNAVEQQLDR